MKKSNSKKRGNKLTLARETLCRLQGEELMKVDGQGKPTADCTLDCPSAKTFCASCLCPI